MDKLTYLAELAEGLARWVPERERQDILRYYAEYFEEAGPGREAEVIRELGDPWALSCRLAVEGGFVTQEQAEGWTPPPKKKWPWVLAAVLALLIGSAVSAATWFGHTIFTTEDTPVQAIYDEGTTVVEEGTEIKNFGGIAQVVDGAEYAEGFWTMEDGNLEMFDTIDVDISFGNITVTGGEDYTLFIMREGDLGGYELKWEIADGALQIRDVKRGGFHLGLDGLVGEHSLNVSITVPSTAVMEKINVETDLGDVFLSEVYAETKIEAKTALGDVECYEVREAKKLTLKSDLGDVTLGMGSLYSGMEIDLVSTPI